MESYNKLTPAETERLALLMEECAEVQQVIGKILRHGYEEGHPKGNTTNREDLEKEIGHALYAVALLDFKGDIRKKAYEFHSISKNDTVAKYLHHNTLKV